jgi:hypothetical protein
VQQRYQAHRTANHFLGFACWDVNNESVYKFSSSKVYFAVVITAAGA